MGRFGAEPTSEEYFTSIAPCFCFSILYISYFSAQLWELDGWRFILIYSFTGLCPWPLGSTHFGQKLKGTQVYCRKELFMSWQNKAESLAEGHMNTIPSGILPLAQRAFIKLSQLLKVVCPAGNQHSKQACRRHFNTSYDTHYTLTKQGWLSEH